MKNRQQFMREEPCVSVWIFCGVIFFSVHRINGLRCISMEYGISAHLTWLNSPRLVYELSETCEFLIVSNYVRRVDRFVRYLQQDLESKIKDESDEINRRVAVYAASSKQQFYDLDSKCLQAAHAQKEIQSAMQEEQKLRTDLSADVEVIALNHNTSHGEVICGQDKMYRKLLLGHLRPQDSFKYTEGQGSHSLTFRPCRLCFGAGARPAVFLSFPTHHLAVAGSQLHPLVSVRSLLHLT